MGFKHLDSTEARPLSCAPAGLGTPSPTSPLKALAHWQKPSGRNPRSSHAERRFDKSHFQGRCKVIRAWCRKKSAKLRYLSSWHLSRRHVLTQCSSLWGGRRPSQHQNAQTQTSVPPAWHRGSSKQGENEPVRPRESLRTAKPSSCMRVTYMTSRRWPAWPADGSASNIFQRLRTSSGRVPGVPRDVPDKQRSPLIPPSPRRWASPTVPRASPAPVRAVAPTGRRVVVVVTRHVERTSGRGN